MLHRCKLLNVFINDTHRPQAFLISEARRNHLNSTRSAMGSIRLIYFISSEDIQKNATLTVWIKWSCCFLALGVNGFGCRAVGDDAGGILPLLDKFMIDMGALTSKTFHIKVYTGFP